MTGESSLEELRSQLDRIDDSLLDALHARLECCVNIACFKRKHGVPMMQSQRINIVQERVALYAEQHNIDAEFLHHLYEIIITETCRVEDLVIGGKLEDACLE